MPAPFASVSLSRTSLAHLMIPHTFPGTPIMHINIIIMLHFRLLVVTNDVRRTLLFSLLRVHVAYIFCWLVFVSSPVLAYISRLQANCFSGSHWPSACLHALSVCGSSYYKQIPNLGTDCLIDLVVYGNDKTTTIVNKKTAAKVSQRQYERMRLHFGLLNHVSNSFQCTYACATSLDSIVFIVVYIDFGTLWLFTQPMCRLCCTVVCWLLLVYRASEIKIYNMNTLIFHIHEKCVLVA